MSELFNNPGSTGSLKLPINASADIDASQIEWRECGVDGFWIKPLLEDAVAGVRCWLMRLDPGAVSAPHTHAEIEQIYVLEGSFHDQDKSYGPGAYIVRAPGALHSAGSDDGALVLLVYTPAAQ